jgi:hypothetical protein
MPNRIVTHMDPPACGRQKTPFLPCSQDRGQVTCKSCVRILSKDEKKPFIVHMAGAYCHTACCRSCGNITEAWERVTCRRCLAKKGRVKV